MLTKFQYPADGNRTGKSVPQIYLITYNVEALYLFSYYFDNIL